VDVITRRRACEEDPGDFRREWADAEDELQMKLKHAMLRLPSIAPGDDILNSVAGLCAAVGVDGHRADLVMVRAACANAALRGSGEVTLQDVARVAPMVLAHRMKRTPFGDEGYDEQMVQSAMNEMFDSDPAQQQSGEPEQPDGGPSDGAQAVTGGGSVVEPGGGDTVDQAVERLVTAADQARRSLSGRRAASLSDDSRGRYVKAQSGGVVTSGSDIAFDATLRNAAVHQSSREGELAIQIKPSEIMTKVRKRKVALAPTASVELAQVKLKQLPTGGATPLAHGILKSLEVIEGEIRRDEKVVPWIVLVTDGRANVGLDGGLGSEDARAAAVKARASSANILVIDTCNTATRDRAARELADLAGADYVQTDASDVVALTGAVKKALG
jgi:magnesium chelatase subunit D